MKVNNLLTYLLITLIIGFYSTTFAQEHPEHPTKSKVKKEHPEHPVKKEHPAKKEHPEHPAKEKAEKEHPAKEAGQHEHPEHPSKNKKAHLTIEEFASAVDNYVAEQTKKNDGYFLVKDSKQGKTLKCKLKKIHKERLASLGDNEFFVCADFEAADGNTYDIDIFMKGTSKDDLKATRTMVHKDNGTPRYSWYEEDGTWKTEEVKPK